MKKNRILRYSEDRWQLAYTFMVLAVQLGLFRNLTMPGLLPQ